MKIFAASLGCPKNSIDTELALGSLLKVGISHELASNPDEADVILVNTCGFIESAVSESIEAILSLAENKRGDQTLVAMGCMVERYLDEIKKELPEVDIFIGARSPKSLGDILKKRLKPDLSLFHPAGNLLINDRHLTTPPWRAYLKISEGCSHGCTYCLIPRLRGPHRPFSSRKILKEAKNFSSRGLKELTLVGQDLTAYRDENMDLKGLLEILADESGVPWIRLLYLNPWGIDDALLETISSHPSICRYLDIPIQHAGDRILKRMGRRYKRKDIEGLFMKIRGIIPDATLRTTVMVGFPGETEEDFQVLREFIKSVRFDHLGCFVYSDEEESPSHSLPHKVDKEVAEERRREIMTIQAEISKEKNALRVGRVEEVLIEGYSQETDLLLEGRTRREAPEIDGVVYINSGIANAGDLIRVKITEAHIYDVVGEIIPGYALSDFTESAMLSGS